MQLVTKPYEKILFKGEKYSLTSRFVDNSNLWPFSKYIEMRKDIDIYSEGYKAEWSLIDNKLFLVNLVGLNKTKEELFNTSDSVFCEWFNGEIELGLGECLDHFNSYKNHLWFKFEKGVVIEEKIIKNKFDDSNKFTFGEYEGTNINRVLEGGLKHLFLEPIITHIKEAIKYYIQYFSLNNFSKSIICSNFKIDEYTQNIVNEFRGNNINYFISKNYIALNPNEAIENQDVLLKNFSFFIEKVFNSEFNPPKVLKHPNSQDKSIEYQTIINPDINYINWAIKNVDTFAVLPEILEQKFNYTILKRFKTNRLNHLIFEYEPIFEQLEYKFPNEIIKLNQEKFEKLNNVVWDRKNKIYITEYSNTKEEKKENNPDYCERESYNDYSGSYAQDYAGYSDGFIDDVFEGDPDNYWNID